MLTSLLLLVGGLALLAASADRFVLAACEVARRLNVTPTVIGLTVVALGTSLPEMLVSATAAHNGAPAMSLGNAVGSNIANIALVMGVGALVVPLTVNSNILRREFPILLAVTALAWGLLLDGVLSRVDATVLSAVSVLVLWLIVRAARSAERRNPPRWEIQAQAPIAMSGRGAVLWLSLGLLLMVAGSRMTVVGASGIALAMGISDLVIGLSIVAVGTSLPELAASVASALRGQADIAVGNVLGSNMLNLLPVLAIAGFITPFDVDNMALRRDFPIMALLTVILLFMCIGWRGSGRVTRLNGAILVTCFIAYQSLLYVMRA